MIKIIPFWLIFLFLFFCTQAQQIDYKGFPEWSWHKEGNTEYYLYTPSAAIEGKKYPVAIFLHGCCGEDDHATLRNAVDPPVRMWHNLGENTQQEPTFIIAPKTTRGWEQKFPDIKKVVDDLIKAGKADPRRVYMTGFSMGGAGTWQFLEKYPGYIAAAIPMGTGIRAEVGKVKDTPVWAIRGEFDYYAQKLDSQVAAMRKLNGYDGGSQEWITGVNPMYTSFEGLGHGIQWEAVSTQKLLDWAYSKVNDGNISPVVFFTSPAYNQVYSHGDSAILSIHAFDNDGNISGIQLYVNQREEGMFKKSQVFSKIALNDGDNEVQARAVDNEGKTSVAKLILRTDTYPQITSTEMPEGQAGAMYYKELFAIGNMPVKFRISEGTILPEGLRLEEGKIIKGIPVLAGEYIIHLTVADDDGDISETSFPMHIRKKAPDEILLTRVHSVSDTLVNIVSKMMEGELPNMEAGTEVFFSNVGNYAGITYISTSAKQADIQSENLLSFHTDQDVTVYVAYEKLDKLFTSTVPEWLSEYHKEQGNQVIAQYHYFDVYSKDFNAGEVRLPGAESTKNNVLCNYFVMVKKKGVYLNSSPEITTRILSPVRTGVCYEERFTTIGGEGKLHWTLISGRLPEGFTFSSEGLISGITYAYGDYKFSIGTADLQGDTDRKTILLKILPNGTGQFKIKD